MILPLYLTTQESAKRHARMPALVEKDNRLIRHCRASKYKNGPVIGMRVPLYIEEELISVEPVGIGTIGMARSPAPQNCRSRSK